MSLRRALPRTRRASATLQRLKQAKEGERIVAEYLDALRDEDCYVTHDLTGDKFNVDHVVIGPHGIFTVETKTISKPLKGSAKVLYDHGGGGSARSVTPSRKPNIRRRGYGACSGTAQAKPSR